MWKHLRALLEMGECTMASAGRRPVGAGWTAENRRHVESFGYRVVLREESERLSLVQAYGIAYASVCKALRLERAFGHSNPYHRHAFPAHWWRRVTAEADLAVIHYSFWAGLPCACPKAVVLLDLWSDFMWEGPRREIEDLKTADLVIVISEAEERKLHEWGITRTLWSPPAVPATDFADSDAIGLLGSASPVNREGLDWLASADRLGSLGIRVYGGLAAHADDAVFSRVGRYESNDQPYRDCGIILMTTALGMGVQIKTIEALAAGRAIVARRGAMRGIPEGQGAWIEVETPDAMRAAARRLREDADARRTQMAAARAYYRAHLDADKVIAALKAELAGLAGKSGNR